MIQSEILPEADLNMHKHLIIQMLIGPVEAKFDIFE